MLPLKSDCNLKYAIFLPDGSNEDQVAARVQRWLPTFRHKKSDRECSDKNVQFSIEPTMLMGSVLKAVGKIKVDDLSNDFNLESSSMFCFMRQHHADLSGQIFQNSGRISTN